MKQILKDQPIIVVHILTVPASLYFFHGNVGYMRSQNVDVHFICSSGEYACQFAAAEGVSVHNVSMTRRITPLKDIVALLQIWRLLRQIKPKIVHVHTPKASLLGITAAWLTCVPVRVYQVRGLRYQGADGYKRRFLQTMETLTCRLAQVVICNSHSVQQTLVDDGLVSIEKTKILHHGSGNGVDASALFNPLTTVPLINLCDHINIGFVGRLVKDKGVFELLSAWQKIKKKNKNVRMLILGEFEDNDAVYCEIKQILFNDAQVRFLGFIDRSQMPAFYASLGVLVLPTYREGFPNVLLEAAAMELPVVATRVTGCVDAVIDGVTGTLIPVCDADALADALQQYIDNPDLRLQHGQAGRQRVLRDFRPEDIWSAIYTEYIRLLTEKGCSYDVL